MMKTPLDIESLVEPGTPQTVIDMYKGLAEEARLRSFGLIEDDIVVLDTETTGLSFAKCELIEIAAAKLSGREVVDRFHVLIKPKKPIPDAIVQLTGITNEAVADGMPAKQAVAELAQFVGGLPIIAHNATFDRTFIESVKGGYAVSNIWIDSLALSRIALPCLTTHKLSDLAEAFECSAVSHQASDDVDALCGMWRIFLCALSHLPADVLNTLATMQLEVDWPYRPIFAHLAQEYAGSAKFSLAQFRKSLFVQNSREKRRDPDEAEEPYVPVRPDEIEQAFSKSGTVGQMYKSYEARLEQTSMALAVADALSYSQHAVIEAGTGVGKSIAYLLPSALFAQRNAFGVGIATKTNALTDQLISHELPLLQHALPHGVNYCSLKGFDHYPCLRKLEIAAHANLPLDQVSNKGKRSDDEIASDMLTAIAVVYSYACQTLFGDLDSLGIRWRWVPKHMLTTTSEGCQRYKCPFYSRACMLHGARERAAEADIVVTNHSLLLRDILTGGRVLPPLRHWVIDEAHSFENEARDQWAFEASSDTTHTMFDMLGGIRTGAIHAAIACLKASEAGAPERGLLVKGAAALSRAQVATADMFAAVDDFAQSQSINRGYATTDIWINSDMREDALWLEVKERAQQALVHLEEAHHEFVEAANLMRDDHQSESSDLLSALRGLEQTIEALTCIMSGADSSYVYSVRIESRPYGSNKQALRAEKLEIGQDLATKWLAEIKSVIFTSATITVGNDFDHFKTTVGLNEFASLEPHEHILKSSFNFDEHMAVIVPTDLPDNASYDYAARLEDLLFDVHVAMDGSVLTLFTNKREMENVYHNLQPRLKEAGLSLACQDTSTSAQQLRTRFINEKKLSLFALKSFWEGFDAAGETLRCVIVPRLPFASPNDPIVRERAVRDQRSWWKHSLPEAVIAVRQAAGRLIRTNSDKGILILADPRLVTKRYGKTFISSMPSNNVQGLQTDEIGPYISSWRKRHE